MAIRKLVKNIITKEEAEELKVELGMDLKFRLDENNIIMNILKKLNFDSELHSESFGLINLNNNGHEWHKDTGSVNHMAWCKYGISILISNPELTVPLQYKDPIEDVSPEDHHMSAVVHDSGQWHMIGMSIKRIAILIFI